MTKKAEAGMAPPTYNDAMYPKQPGSNPAMTQPFPPYPTQAGVAPYPTQPGQPAYPAGNFQPPIQPDYPHQQYQQTPGYPAGPMAPTSNTFNQGQPYQNSQPAAHMAPQQA